MHASRIVPLMVAVLPGAALANMSHVSVGGAIFVLAVVAVVLLVPPLLGSLLAAKGHRKKSYGVSLIVWLGMLFSAFYFYSQLSPYTQAQMSPWAVPQAVGLLALVYTGAVLVYTRVLPRFRKSSVKQPHAGA